MTYTGTQNARYLWWVVYLLSFFLLIPEGQEVWRTGCITLKQIPSILVLFILCVVSVGRASDAK